MKTLKYIEKQIVSSFLIIAFVVGLIPANSYAIQFDGKPTNDTGPTYKKIANWTKKHGANDPDNRRGYEAITKWTKKNLKKPVSSGKIIKAMKEFTVKGMNDRIVDREDYVKLKEWSKRNFTKDFSVNRHIKTTWAWANESTKKNWEQAKYLKKTPAFIKMFFRKDTKDQHGALVHKAAKGFRKFTKSEFMNEDFKDFNFVKRVLKSMGKDVTVRVSKIIKTDIEKMKDAAERANSDTTKVAGTVLRSIWLVTKEGAYLFVALPVLLTAKSAAVITAVSWKVLSRSVAVIARSLLVVGAVAANVVTPVLAVLWPVVDIAVLRVGGTAGIYTVATIATAGLGIAFVGRYAGLGIATAGGFVGLGSFQLIEGLGRNVVFPTAMGLAFLGVYAIGGAKALYKYVAIPTAAGVAYVSYSVWLGIKEGSKKLAIGTAALGMTGLFSTYKLVKALFKAPGYILGKRVFKFYFPDHEVITEDSLVDLLERYIPVGEKREDSKFYTEKKMDGSNEVVLHYLDEKSGKDIVFGKLKLYQQFGQYAMFLKVKKSKLRRQVKRLSKKKNMNKVVQELFSIFSDFGNSYFPEAEFAVAI